MCGGGGKTAPIADKGLTREEEEKRRRTVGWSGGGVGPRAPMIKPIVGSLIGRG